MKDLKEAYGQSQELNAFVYQSKSLFNTYYKVTINNPNTNPKFEQQYFAFEDAAREYYNKLKEDLKKYNWDSAEIALIEVHVTSNEEELDSLIYFDDEEEEDFVEIDDTIEDEE